MDFFTLNDRVRIQKYLGLHPNELEMDSDLSERLSAVEERDVRLGTDLGVRIVARLDILDGLSSEIDAFLGNSDEFAVSGRNSRVDGEYSFGLSFNNSEDSTLVGGFGAKSTYFNRLIREIKVDLGYFDGYGRILLG